MKTWAKIQSSTLKSLYPRTCDMQKEGREGWIQIHCISYTHLQLFCSLYIHRKSVETPHLCLKILDRAQGCIWKIRLQWQLQEHCRLEGLWEAWTATSCVCEMLRGGSLCHVEAGGQQPPSWNIQLEGKPALPTALGTAGCWGPSHSPLPTHCRPASSWYHVQNSNILKAVLAGFSREQCLKQLQRVACDCSSPLHSEYSW